MYEVAIQAVVGNKIIARSTVKAMRKDVTQSVMVVIFQKEKNCWKSRKRENMKSVGSVEIPQTAFMAVLKLDEK